MSLKYPQLQPFYVYNTGASIGATSVVFSEMKKIDGTALAMTDFGDKGFATVRPNEGSGEMQISFTGLTQNGDGTTTLTGVSDVLMVSPYTESSGLSQDIPGGSKCVVSVSSGMLNTFVNKQNDETIAGTHTFSVANRPKLSADADATLDEELVDLGQLNRTSLGAAVNTKVLSPGTAGETVAAGDPLYLKAADGYWWKADASVITTADVVAYGIAQGAGTAGVAITGGVLKNGRDANNTGLTNGQKQYLQDGGGIGTSAGTVEVTLGYGLPDGTFYFQPKYDQQITEDQQDALAGTSGTPSATNKFVTNDDTSATAAASKVVRANASGYVASGFLTPYLTNVQDFLTDGTWTKPTGAVSVEVICIGAGGGGEAGTVAQGGNADGGAGGGGGAVSLKTFKASELGATVAVTVGIGGTGGLTTGAAGTNGTSSTFSTYLTAGGGGGGGVTNLTGGGGGGVLTSATGATGGTPNAGAAAGVSLQGCNGPTAAVGFCAMYGGGSGAGGNTVSTGAAGGSSIYGAGAGGSGADTDTGAAAGGAGGASWSYTAGGGGTAGANPAGNGGAGSPNTTTLQGYGGDGGGGGGVSNNAADTAGNGGAGGAPGGGGGGGGANRYDASPPTVVGAGGAGAAGLVRVITFF